MPIQLLNPDGLPMLDDKPIGVAALREPDLLVGVEATGVLP